MRSRRSHPVERRRVVRRCAELGLPAVLDWVATVPPTLALTREAFGASAPVAFGWIFASHQLGAACAALAAGIARDALGTYDAAWYGGAVLCAVGAGLSVSIRRRPTVPAAAPLAPAPEAPLSA